MYKIFALFSWLLLLLLRASNNHAYYFEKSLIKLEEKTCSIAKLGVGLEDCFAVHLRMPRFTAALLEEALGPEDSIHRHS